MFTVSSPRTTVGCYYQTITYMHTSAQSHTCTRYTHVHTHFHTLTLTHTHAHTHTHTHARTHARTRVHHTHHTHTHTSKHACTHACTHPSTKVRSVLYEFEKLPIAHLFLAYLLLFYVFTYVFIYMYIPHNCQFSFMSTYILISIYLLTYFNERHNF